MRMKWELQSKFLDYLWHSTSRTNEGRKAIYFFLSLVPACFNIGRGFSSGGIIRPFVSEAQRSTGSSAKTTPGEEKSKLQASKVSYYFHPCFFKGLAINKDLTKLSFACTAAILIIDMHLVDLLCFLHNRAAAVNIALGCFYITEIHIIVIFLPFSTIIISKKNEKVFLLLRLCCHSPCPLCIICLLIIWTTVKVLKETQTKTLELTYNTWHCILPNLPIPFCNQILIWYHGWKSWNCFWFWPYFCLSLVYVLLSPLEAWSFISFVLIPQIFMFLVAWMSEVSRKD